MLLSWDSVFDGTADSWDEAFLQDALIHLGFTMYAAQILASGENLPRCLLGLDNCPACE